MKRAKKRYRLIGQMPDGFVPLLLTTILLPFVVLVGFGVVSLVEKGLWLLFFAIIVVSCLVVFLTYWWMCKQRNVDTVVSEELNSVNVDANPAWTEYDNHVWLELNKQIKAQLEQDPEWETLREHALTLVANVVSHYHRDGKSQQLAFTAPEFLLMVEEVSRRYRIFLQEHIPFAEKIRLTTLQQGYAMKDKVGYAKAAYNVYRLFRIVTPTGWLSEARGLVIGKLFDEVSGEAQYKIKQTLLQEVASVAIDLYSGRFKLSDASLPHSKVSRDDNKNLAAEIEPLRVAVIGQVSAGKSSVINALLGGIAAEVSALPTTDKATVYTCEVEDSELIHLVDLPGIDGRATTTKQLVKQIANSDVVLWVLKANQPARNLDVELKHAVDLFYHKPENQHRKEPKILALVSQVDRLQPVDEWLPPHDLVNSQTPKATVIRDAVAYNQKLIHADAILPVSVGGDKTHYHVDELRAILKSAYEDGVHTQLNRRRIEGDSIDYTKQAKRLYRLSKLMFISKG